MNIRKVEIKEIPNGWSTDGKFFPTAADALRAVKKQDKLATKLGVSTITTIEWAPTTKIGLRVVRALVN